ncbi:MAG: cytochrome P450 [Candidatus Rokuibacteriota bacterium]|nr:MAG: cytochrome P450 [Candidatus Rokubacteria bacterium]
MSVVPTPTTTLSLDEINLASFDFWMRDDVDGALAKLRHERPVAWHEHKDSGKGFWSFTRYDDVAAITRDWETFSSQYGIQAMTDPEDTEKLGIRSMISTDPPKHTKLRALVNRGFTPRAVARAEANVRNRAREIVDAIAPKGECELVSEVSSVLPVAVICDMMGVPKPDRPLVLELTNRLLAGGDPEFGGTKESLADAGRRLREYGLWLGKARFEKPEDDITSTLVQAEVDGEAMPPEDLGPFILLLIAAGNETTRTAISQGIWALTQFPDEKRRWLQDLDGRAATAAEEIVRWATPVLHMRRTVSRDTPFGGVEMKKDDKVVIWYLAANRDETQFTDPYRFDIMREPNHQGGFGTGGAHFCLGAHLARRELICTLTELLRRLPDIEATAPPEKLRSNFIHGIKRLPVAFKPIRV